MWSVSQWLQFPSSWCAWDLSLVAQTTSREAHIGAEPRFAMHSAIGFPLRPSSFFLFVVLFLTQGTLSLSCFCCVVVLYLLLALTQLTPAAAVWSSLNNLQHKFTSGPSSTASALSGDKHSTRSLSCRQDRASCSQPGAVSHSKQDVPDALGSSGSWSWAQALCQAAPLATRAKRSVQLNITQNTVQLLALLG